MATLKRNHHAATTQRRLYTLLYSTRKQTDTSAQWHQTTMSPHSPLSKPIKRASSQRTIRPAPMGTRRAVRWPFRALTEPNDRLLSMLCLQTAHPTSCEAFCNLTPTANSAKPRCSRSWRASMVLPSGQDRVTDRSVTLLTSTVCQPEDATEPAQGVRGRDHSNGRQAPPERLSRSGPGRHVRSPPTSRRHHGR